MRIIFLILSVSILPLVLQAQSSDSIKTKEVSFYVDIGMNNRFFLVDYKTNSSRLQTSNYFIGKTYHHIGYKLNKRIRFEVGFSYGYDNDHSSTSFVLAPGKYIENHYYYKTRALILPFKIIHNLFYFNNKRIGIYGTASIMPIYSFSEVKELEIKEGETTTTFSENNSGLNTFFSFGIGGNFKIWKRFSGYSEINLLNKNLSSDKNSDPFYFERRHSRFGYLRYINYGLGINYNLMQKYRDYSQR